MIPSSHMGLRYCAALVGVCVAAMATAAGCVQTQRALGEDCLKDQDCLSGVCSQLQCAAAPPILQGVPPASTADAQSPMDAAVADTAVGQEAAPDTGSAGSDTGAGGDSAAQDGASE
jgi:hypothetical protein